MRGLLYKEYALFKPQLKSWTGALVILSIYAILFKNLSMLLMLIAIAGTMVSANSFSYDRMYHCEEWIAAMPVSRKQMVMAKYLFLLAMDLILSVVLVTAVMGVGVMFHADLLDILASGCSVLAVTVLLQSVSLPLIYKLGPEKARIFYALIGIAPMVLLFVLKQMEMLPPLTDELGYLILKALPFIGIAAMSLSFVLSVRIYRKKEF